jgi:hypothetical protein
MTALAAANREPVLELYEYGQVVPVKFVAFYPADSEGAPAILFRGKHIHKIEWDSNTKRFSWIPHQHFLRLAPAE